MYWNNLHTTLNVYRNNMDIGEVSSALGLNAEAIEAIENGKRSVSKEELKMFASLYNKTLKDLLMPTYRYVTLKNGMKIKIIGE